MAKELNSEYKYLIPYLSPLLQGFAAHFPLDELGGARQLESFKKVEDSDGEFAIAVSYWIEGGDSPNIETDLFLVCDESYEKLANSMLQDFAANNEEYYKVKIIHSYGKVVQFVPKAEKIILEKVSYNFLEV
jgi:hypothetical protein